MPEVNKVKAQVTNLRLHSVCIYITFTSYKLEQIVKKLKN